PSDSPSMRSRAGRTSERRAGMPSRRRSGTSRSPGRGPPDGKVLGVFIGTVQCEVELSKTHRAFDGFRFLLIEPEHEVEWEGAVVAVDTVSAQVGDMVVVALAPLGSQFDVPEDLPIDGAVVGIVSSITTPAEEGGEREEEGAAAGEESRVRM